MVCDAFGKCTLADSGYYYDSAVDQILKCDNTKCATCTSAVDCIIPCEVGCNLCNGTGVC